MVGGVPPQDNTNAPLKGPGNSSTLQPWQLRSQSLPRLASNTAANLAVANLTSSQAGNPSLLGDGAGSTSAAAAAAAAGVLQDSRFVRAAKTVGECLGRVKTLSEAVNSATGFRESCSKLLGAAFAASLALQELLSGHTSSKDRDLLVQRFAAELQSKLLSAVTLVDKYGHEGLWHRLTRFEGKQQVAAKFSGLQQELHDISQNIWDLIDPQNRVKRNVFAQDPEVGKMLTTGNAFSRHTLRKGDGSSKVSALLAFPDEEGGSGQGQEGMVVWGADSAITLTLPSSKFESVIKGAGGGLSCLLYDPRGFLWAGYVNGCVAMYHVHKAAVAAEKLAVADATITALAVDAQTGLCWAGTEEGVVVIVSFTLHSKEGWQGKLDHLATLMAPGATLPSTSSVDSSPTTSMNNAASTAAAAAAAAVDGRRPPGGGSTAGSRRSQHCGSSSSSHKRSSARSKRRRQQHSIAEADGLDGLWGSCLGGTIPSVVATSSQRLKEVTIHAGPVSAIAIHGGRAYTAGGSNAFNSTLLVWDTDSYSLLRVISKRTTSWARSPATCLTIVHWASSRRHPCSSTGLGPLSQYGSCGMQSQDGSSCNVNSGLSSTGGHTRSSSVGLPDTHLISGHANGSVLVWDPSNDDLQPVLLVGPDSVSGSKRAVQALVVLEELGVLATGHANGRVIMRKLDPKVPLHPRDDGGIGRWSPTPFSLQAHRLGLGAMVGHGHMLVTAGKTGSIKLWPETTLRCLASEANVQLPYSRNPISEAVNSLLHRAGMMASYPSLSQPAGSYGAAGLSPAQTAGTSLQQQQQQQQRQQQSAFAGAATGAAAGAAATAAAAGAPAQQQRQQQQQAEPPGAVLNGSQRGQRQQQQQWEQQDEDGSGADYERLHASNWVIDWSRLNIDLNSRRKCIGQGSYGRVQIGCYNQTDVAVKILTDAGGGGSRVSGDGGGADGSSAFSTAAWDKVRLEKLLHEVGILSTLRHPNVVLFMGVCLSPPAVVTEYCPLRSLYDVLKKANSDASLAARLTWGRRLRMALDAAKGLVHLHNHKPTILHRDLKSPNLFVMTNYTVKVGDFNLSRYMALDTSYVQSSLELNPRWSAPEVIGSGFYSTAADVYSFGVVLWELLTWQEPWDEEELSSYQIMTAVQQEALRPQLPPLDQLPGQVGPAAAVSAYIDLMEACWSQNPRSRPTFDQVVDRLKELVKIEGPNQHPGTKACQAAAAAAPSVHPPPQRGVSETAAMAAAAAAMAAAARGTDGTPAAATPAAAAAAAAAGVGPGGCHLRSRSEVVGGAAAAAAAAGGPETADLLQLGLGDDDLLGPSAPRPPPAALPPIPGTSDDGSSYTPSSEGPGRSSFRGSAAVGDVAGFSGAAAAAAGGAGGAAGAAPLPPRAPRNRGLSAIQAGAAVTAAAGGRAPGVAGSPFAAAGYTEEEPFTPRQLEQQQQQQQQQQQGSADRIAGTAGFSGSPFASQTAQQDLDEPPAASSSQQQQEQQQYSGGVQTPTAAAAAAAAAAGSSSGPLRCSDESGGLSGGLSGTPRSSTGGGMRSPGLSIRPSPFASIAAAAALLDEGCSSGMVGAAVGAAGSSNNSLQQGSVSGGGFAGAAASSGGGGGGTTVSGGVRNAAAAEGSVTSPPPPLLPLLAVEDVVDRSARQRLVDAAVDAASAVAAGDRRKPRKSGSSSGAGGGEGQTAAAAAGGLGAGSSSRSGGGGGGASQQQHQQQRQAGGSQSSSSGAGACVPDLISLDSESAETGAAAPHSPPATGRR